MNIIAKRSYPDQVKWKGRATEHMKEVTIETKAVNNIYAEFFGDHKPARVVVPTRNLHHGVLVEIEATAEIPE